ncbi:retrovirus-related pol polyprotein from transposon TNT 1-94 [Tanacetum coccineum]
MFLLLHLLPVSISVPSNHPLVSGLGLLEAHDRAMLSAHKLYRKCHNSRVYYVEGLGHNLFLVGEFCNSDLEVAFRKHTCYVRDFEGVDLLKGSRGLNLYTMSLEEMMQSSPICILSKASKTKSWLWHRRLSHLNFGYINELTKQGLEKARNTPTNPTDNFIQEKLYLLHMDLYGPMRIESINRKNYILVIVADYSRFTWVKFLRSKDETPEIMIKLLNKIQVRLNATVRNIRTDNGTEFVHQNMQAYYDDVGISHQTSAEAVLTACYTQNRSLIRRRHNKTPYELLHDRKPDLTYFYVFGALCYPTNDDEDLGKLKSKADIGIFLATHLLRRLTKSITDEPNPPSSTPYVPPTKIYRDILFQPMFDEYFNSPSSVVSPVPAAPAPIPVDLTGSPSLTSIDQDAPSTSTPSITHETQSTVISEGVEEQSFLDILTSEPSS